MRLVLLSDTHTMHDRVDVPHGDVLIHAGDFTSRGKPQAIIAFDQWLRALRLRPNGFKHIVVIAGNHDLLFERQPERARELLTACHYLQDSEVRLDGVRFYGSPWQPRFYDWAFNLPRGMALANKWSRIPTDTDVLITHGPPRGILDQCTRDERVGCGALRGALRRVKPCLHVFGHIHEAYGVERVGETLYVNASTCTAKYQPTNAPIVVELGEDGCEVVSASPRPSPLPRPAST